MRRALARAGEARARAEARAGALEGTVVTKLKNKKKQLRISYSVEGATEK